MRDWIIETLKRRIAFFLIKGLLYVVMVLITGGVSEIIVGQKFSGDCRPHSCNSRSSKIDTFETSENSGNRIAYRNK